jgi:hypothetical protein
MQTRPNAIDDTNFEMRISRAKLPGRMKQLMLVHVYYRLLEI